MELLLGPSTGSGSCSKCSNAWTSYTTVSVHMRRVEYSGCNTVFAPLHVMKEKKGKELWQLDHVVLTQTTSNIVQFTSLLLQKIL